MKTPVRQSLWFVLLALQIGFAQSPPQTVPSEANPAKRMVVLPAGSITAPLDDIFNGQIATIISCHGFTIGSFWSSVNWGDNSLSAGSLTSPPGSFTASHIFTVANTYVVPISTTEKCVNMDAYGNGSTFPDAVATSITIAVAPAAAPSSISLSTASVSGGTPVTATVSIAAAASVDTRVWMGTSSTWAIAPPVVTIPAGQTSVQTTLTTQAPTPSPQNVTVFAVSGGVSRSTVLRVN